MNPALTSTHVGSLQKDGPTNPLDLNRLSAESPKKLRPLRFASGMLLSTSGMGLILLVGLQMMDVRRIGGDFALVLVAGCVLTGVILLGGGFGLMATAASGFDEREFDLLLQAGNISSASMPFESQVSESAPSERSPAATRSPDESKNAA